MDTIIPQPFFGPANFQLYKSISKMHYIWYICACVLGPGLGLPTETDNSISVVGDNGPI